MRRRLLLVLALVAALLVPAVQARASSVDSGLTLTAGVGFDGPSTVWGSENPLRDAWCLPPGYSELSHCGNFYVGMRIKGFSKYGGLEVCPDETPQQSWIPCNYGGAYVGGSVDFRIVYRCLQDGSRQRRRMTATSLFGQGLGLYGGTNELMELGRLDDDTIRVSLFAQLITDDLRGSCPLVDVGPNDPPEAFGPIELISVRAEHVRLHLEGGTRYPDLDWRLKGSFVGVTGLDQSVGYPAVVR